MYIITHCNYSQPTLIKLYNENIGGHLTPLQAGHDHRYHYEGRVLCRLAYLSRCSVPCHSSHPVHPDSQCTVPV